MSDKTYEVLFICTHNSARSIMAEAMMNAAGRGRFRVHSAGSSPAGRVHPMAIDTLAWMRLPTDGYRSKDWAEFARPGSPALDFVFTVCDKAAGESCPVWPGQPMTAHWGVEDPAAVQGDADVQRKVFRDVATTLKRRIDLMLALPLHSLDKLSLRNELQQIGRR
jgi:arsenate reductase